jgi:hypothetical protein
MVKKSKQSSLSPRLISEKVQIMIRGKNSAAISRYQVLARQMSYLFNVPSESIIPTVKTVQRKDQAVMTQPEKDRYIDGISALINSGWYGSHVAIHADMSHRQHTMSGPIGTQRFLAWHRVYLFELEQKLLGFDQDSFIPYWDWTKDRAVSEWLLGFTPKAIVNGNQISVFRTPGQGASVSLP